MFALGIFFNDEENTNKTIITSIFISYISAHPDIFWWIPSRISAAATTAKLPTWCFLAGWETGKEKKRNILIVYWLCQNLGQLLIKVTKNALEKWVGNYLCSQTYGLYILSPSFQNYETPEYESDCNFKSSSDLCVNDINQLQLVPFVSKTLILWRVGWQGALTNGRGQEGSYTYNFGSSAELLFGLSSQNKYQQFLQRI